MHYAHEDSYLTLLPRCEEVSRSLWGLLFEGSRVIRVPFLSLFFFCRPRILPPVFRRVINTNQPRTKNVIWNQALLKDAPKANAREEPLIGFRSAAVF